MKFSDSFRHIGRKKAILIASACVVLIVSVGLTVAWLTAQSALMTNNFQKAEVTCDVEETFDGQTKSDVSIRNTGSISAYIRVALVPVWKDGANVVGTPASLSDCAMTMGADYNVKWVKGLDGYYYFTMPIPSGQTAPILIKGCTVTTQNGYQFELQIAAQAVQALPAAAVEEIWGCTVLEGGTLEVLQ